MAIRNHRAALAALIFCCAATGRAEVIRVIAYNIESYNSPGSSSWAALTRVVESMPPDILMVQEASNIEGRQAFEDRFSSLFRFRYLAPADGGGNRQQTFSRWPLMNPRAIFAGGFSRPSLRIDVDTDEKDPGPELRLYNVHFKSGFASRDKTLRLAMARAIRADVLDIRKKRPDMRIVFAGDVNEQPGDPSLSLLHEPEFPLNLIEKVDPFTGDPATRPASGRVIDHFVVSDTIEAVIDDVFIYNTATWKPLPEPARVGDSMTAADHLTIVLDIEMIVFRAGDTNTDGSIDLMDVEPFVLTLIDPDAYRAAYPWVEVDKVADVNHDGSVDLRDVEPFVELLIGP